MIVPFSIHDVLKIGFLTGENLVDTARYGKIMQNGDGFVYRDADDIPRLAGGVMRIWNGVGELWMMVDEDMRRNMPVSMARYAKRCVDVLLMRHQFHRVQCHIDVTLERNCRFAEFIGLKREGLMKKYLPNGVDAWRYAMIAGGV